MRLEVSSRGTRIKVIDTLEDKTEELLDWINVEVKLLERADIAAFIFTSVFLGTRNAFARCVTTAPAEAGAQCSIMSSFSGSIISQVVVWYSCCVITILSGFFTTMGENPIRWLLSAVTRSGKKL